MFGNSAQIVSAKEELIRLLSGSLIKEPSFDAKPVCHTDWGAESTSSASSDSNSTSTMSIAVAETKELPLNAMMRLGAQIAAGDGEFLLKLAVYVRQDLGLRGSANFITSIAAYQPNCQPFLSVYLPRIISLPTDWLQIASFARDSPLRSQCGLPAALRTALAAAFKNFNEFSLAKYNTESAQKKRKKDRVAKGENPDDIVMPYTLKQMIRMLHISEPRYEVMCLLGKSYPATPQAFSDLGLETPQRAFDPARMNRRMRLAVPLTWETELAAKGNHAHVWNALVKDRKLPFMAMLRNLRNIILAGCARETHTELLDKLRSEDQIGNSKQFPYRFFSAFDVLTLDPATAYAPQVKREGAPTKAKPKPATAPSTEELGALLSEYRDALQEAVRLATKLNIRPIHGRSVVFIHGNTEMLSQVRAQGTKGIGSVRSKLDVALLLAIMLQYACEACDLVLFNEMAGTHHILPALDRSLGMLDALTQTKARVEGMLTGPDSCSDWGEEGSVWREEPVIFPYPYLDKIINSKERIESILLVTNRHCSYQGGNRYPALGSLKDYLVRLRRDCNPNLLFVNLSIEGGDAETDIEQVFDDPNDVLLTGFSDSILRFIAERSGGGPRQYIEHIHEVYKIDTSRVGAGGSTKKNEVRSPLEASSDDDDSESSGSDDDSEPRTTAKVVVAHPPPQRRLVSSYRAMRCFISSTFTDMQCERSALMSDVFPALRSWISSRGWHIHVTPIDFRWGILAEAGTGPLPTAASVCLAEVSRCSPFVLGLIGSRYGSVNTLKRLNLVTSDADVDQNDFDWLTTIPGEGVGLSITELELRHALHCLQRCGASNMAASSPRIVVLQRSIKGQLPPKLQSSFTDSTKDAQSSIRRLVGVLQESDGAVVTPYSATTHQRPNATAEDILDMTEFSKVALAQLKEQILTRWPSLNQSTNDDGPEELSMSATNFVTLKLRPGDTNSSGSDDDAASTVSRAPTTVPPSGTEANSDVEGDEEQTYFRQTLLAPYVPPKEAFRAAQRFLDGDAVGAASLEDDASSETNGAAGAPVLLVHADEGAGKSSFVSHVAAEAAQQLDRKHKTPFVAVQFSFQALQSTPVDCLRFVAASLVSQCDLLDTVPSVPHDGGENDKDALLKLLPQVYAACDKKARSLKGKVLIVVDGVDVLPHESILAILATLIPSTPPSRILFIVATHAGSPVAAALKARPQPTAFIRLPLLSIKERILVVQRHLSTLSKTLQDSVTKGSMVRVLCRKSDAGLSSYLMLSLTYLALFSKFDTLKQDIRRIPGTLAQLQTDVLRRCEAMFTVAACTSLLTCMTLSQPIGGVTEDVLLATTSNGAESANAARLLAFLKYHDMVREGGAAGRGGSLLNFTSDTLIKASRKRYLAKTAEVHKHHTRLLAQLLGASQTANNGSGNLPGVTAGGSAQPHANANTFEVAPEVLRQLPAHSVLAVLHHSLECKRWGVVLQIGSTIECLVEMVEAGLLPQLLVSMDRLEGLHRPTHRKLQTFSEFLLAHRHILTRHPRLAAQLALNMPPTSAVYKAAKVATLDVARSWVEWHNRHAHGERECTMTTQWTTQRVLCATFSSDGTRLAIGSADWVCRVGLILEGTIQHELKHTTDITAVAFAGAADMNLVTGANDGVVRVWGLHDGALLQELKQHSRRVNDVCVFGKERNMCMSASDDTTVSLWKLHTGGTASAGHRPRPVRTYRHHRAPVSCCAVHQSGQKMATGSWDGRIAVVSTNSDSQSRNGEPSTDPQWLDLRTSIRCVAFVPSMVVTIAIGTFDGALHLYDAAGEVLSATFHQHVHPMSALHISNDAKFMMSTDVSGRIKLWRQSVTGEVVGSLNGHDTDVPTARFHPKDSNQCITGSLDSTVRHWTFREQGIEYPVGALHDSAVSAMAVSSNGAFVVTACRGGTAHVFPTENLATGVKTFSMEPYRHFPCASAGSTPVALCYASFCKDDTLIVLGDIFGTISVWGASPGLSGRDAPKRFMLHNALIHPIVFVTYSSVFNSWIAMSQAGESIRWNVVNMEFATGDPDIEMLDDEVVLDADLTSPIMTAMCIPHRLDQGDSRRTIIVGSKTSLLVGSHEPSAPFKTDSMEFNFVNLGRAFQLLDDHGDARELTHLPPTTHVAFNAALLTTGYEGGYVGFVDMRERDSEVENPMGLVRLRDDRNPRLWMTISCLGLTTFEPHTHVAVGGTDMTVRLLHINAASCRFDNVGIFHTTAAPSAAVFTLDQLVIGDTLGNVYTLTSHHSSIGDDDASNSCEENTASADEAFTVAESSVSGSESTYSASCASSAADMFAELGCSVPAGCRGKDRAQWLKRQQELLKAATKLQRTVPAARVALRRHAQQAFTAFEAYSLL